MSTILFPSPIFGPVQSRRLGVSLGINLLPAGGKICNFDCIYCECGFNDDTRTNQKIPTREEVSTQLEQQLIKMQAANTPPDVITFAGNGEPTIHPAFKAIIQDTIMLRNRYAPQSKISVLSNATLIGRPAVREALMLVDNNILKLDTANIDYINQVNRPTGHYDLSTLISHMKAFQGKLIIQTMFMEGQYNNRSVSNTTDEFILPWLSIVKEINPQEVMIYTIDRETPASTLRKASKETLDRIVHMLQSEGIKASASY